jgi:uncharacterized delta-60 repeat protein
MARKAEHATVAAESSPAALSSSHLIARRLRPGEQHRHRVRLASLVWLVSLVSLCVILTYALNAPAARATSAGQPDPSFGASGVATIAEVSDPQAALVQPDGSILIGGHDGSMPGGGTYARLSAEGALEGVTASGPDTSQTNAITAMAPAPGGKVVVAMTTTVAGVPSMTVVRLLSAGGLDTTFNRRGYARVAYPSGVQVTDVAVAADGSVIVGGLTGTDPSETDRGRGDFVLARFDAAGQLDSTFGSAGELVTGFGRPTAGVTALAFEPGGAILAAGPVGDGQADFGIARFSSRGVLDRSFGQGGEVITDLGGDDRPFAMRVAANGAILAVGAGGSGFAMTQYTSGGVLSSATSTPFASGGAVLDAAFLTDGDVVAAGGAGAGPAPGSFSQFAFARYDPAGSLDSAFGTQGLTTVAVGGSYAFARRLVVQPDGTLLGVGPAGDTATAAIRLTGDVPPLDGGFPPAGPEAKASAAAGARCIAFGERARPRSVTFTGQNWRPGNGTLRVRYSLRRATWRSLNVRSDGTWSAHLPSPVQYGRYIRGFAAHPVAWGERARIFPTARLLAADVADPARAATVLVHFVHTSVGVPFGRSPSAKVVLRVAGFPAHRLVYAHLYRGTLRFTVRLGRARGACGTLMARHALLPAGAAPGPWMVSFSTRRPAPRRYRPRADGELFARPIRIHDVGRARVVTPG